MYDKPLKIQWTEINGRAVPLVLPQYWSDEQNDWVVSSEQNRLPVDAQLTGRKVEEVYVWDALAITDTDSMISPRVDVSKYKEVTFVAFSTHDVGIEVWPFIDTRNNSYYDGVSWKHSGQNRIKLSIPGYLYFLNTAWPGILNFTLREIRFAIQAEQPPTTGSLTLKIWGVPN